MVRSPARLSPRHSLARVPLVLATPQRHRGRWLLATLLLVVAATGAAAWQWSALSAPGPDWRRWWDGTASAQVLQDQQRLQQQLQQAQAQLRLSQAHAGELEKQLTQLQQQLRDSQQELQFFREAQGGRAGRRTTP